jgi:hypothetical protein
MPWPNVVFEIAENFLNETQLSRLNFSSRPHFFLKKVLLDEGYPLFFMYPRVMSEDAEFNYLRR